VKPPNGLPLSRRERLKSLPKCHHLAREAVGYSGVLGGHVDTALVNCRANWIVTVQD
jgi:hypothetical protein